MKTIAARSTPWRTRLTGNGAHRARAALGVLHWRRGWLWSVGLALLASALILEITTNRPLVAELAASHGGTFRLRHASAVSRPVQARLAVDETAHGRTMEALLVAQGSFESQYRRLIEIAAVHRIDLPRAAYLTTWDEAGGVQRVQVSLLMAVRYPMFRSFIEEALRALPAMSLDQVALKRENIAQAQVDVAVQLSFWAQAPLTQPVPLPTTPGPGS